MSRNFRVRSSRRAGIAHLIPESQVDNMTARATGPSICGRGWPASQLMGWKGLEGVNDISETKTIPLCKFCERKVSA